MKDRLSVIASELSHLNQYLDQTKARLNAIDPPLSPVFLGNMDYFMEQVCFYLEVVDE